MMGDNTDSMKENFDRQGPTLFACEGQRAIFNEPKTAKKYVF